jgi:hypothetical protein
MQGERLLGRKYVGLRGLSKTYRLGVATDRHNCWLFVSGFRKNECSNMLAAQAMNKAKRASELIEVYCDAKDHVS